MTCRGRNLRPERPQEDDLAFAGVNHTPGRGDDGPVTVVFNLSAGGAVISLDLDASLYVGEHIVKERCMRWGCCFPRCWL